MLTAFPFVANFLYSGPQDRQFLAILYLIIIKLLCRLAGVKWRPGRDRYGQLVDLQRPQRIAVGHARPLPRRASKEPLQKVATASDDRDSR